MVKEHNDVILDVSELGVTISRDEGQVSPLNGVSLRVKSGQAVGIVGESGCGKTMTSNALLQILPIGAEITSGQMLYRRKGDESLVDLAQIESDSDEMRSVRGGEISMIFQEPMTAFSPVHSIGNQIGEMVRLHDPMGENEIVDRVVELLDLVGIPSPRERIDDFPFQLSGGMRQRAMIAMALASRPRLLIADEPTTALDVTVQARVLKLIGRLQKELDLSLIMITHDLGVIAHTVEYVYVMKDGRVVEEGSVYDIFESPSHPHTIELLNSIPQSKASVESVISIGEDEFTDEMDENDILYVQDLKKYFPIKRGLLQRQVGWVKAVDGVSFSVKKGEILGLVGESGSGKTTTGRMVLRVLDPTGGKIFFRKNNGGIEDMARLSPQQVREVRREMQMIFQDPFASLNPRMPIIDLISEPLRANGWKRDECEARAIELMEQVGLDPGFLRRYPHAFSGGQRQRIGIARALALSPSFIVADEAVSALDVSIQSQILDLLKSLQKELGLTLLFVSHDLSVVRSLCDNVAVMYNGKLVEYAPTEKLFDSPQHSYTAELLKAAPPPDPRAPWLQDYEMG